MLKKILVPLDGSSFAECAAEYAARLARTAGARLEVLHIRSVRAALKAPAFDPESVAGRLRTDRFGVEALTRDVGIGTTGSAIADTAREQGADLIIMSTHGHTGPGRWFYGAVAEETLRQSTLPVMLIPSACERAWPTARPYRILAALDGSDLAEQALEPAAALAEALHATLLLLRVVESRTYTYSVGYSSASTDTTPELREVREYLETVAGRLRSAGRDVEVHLVLGTPVQTIAAVARELDANLIVMRTHSHVSLDHLVLGDVAIGTLVRSSLPVLFVPSATMHRTQAQPSTAVDVRLSPGELELMKYALMHLLEPEHHPRLAEPVRSLLARLERMAPALTQPATDQGAQHVRMASPVTARQGSTLRVFLCGDVMTGRGIDQILPNRCDPVLYESYVRDARAYVALAERVHGPISRPVDPAYIWGDALDELRRSRPDVRLVNLETSVTRSADAWLGKGIHYRMHPSNVGCLTAARIDCCSLANNHTLDWGYAGLAETLATLDQAGIAHAGAGRNATEAAAPAVLDVPGRGRVLVYALGSTTSGIPQDWAATEERPGLNVLHDLSDEAIRNVTDRVSENHRPGDVTIASIHWGANWGYEISDAKTTFARRLVDAGVDIVHGHSSHHVRAIEVYRGRLILYGCGDFLDDYEGIGGHEALRGDLHLMYLATLSLPGGQLAALRLVPLVVRRFRLARATVADAQWLCDLVNRLGVPFGTQAHVEGDSSLTLNWR